MIGISKIRREGEKLCKRKNGNIGNLFYYFGQTKGYREVGFYIHKKCGEKIVEIKEISERVAVLKLDMNREKVITIIQVYALTNMVLENEAEKFYNNIETTLEQDRGITQLKWEIGMQK